MPVSYSISAFIRPGLVGVAAALLGLAASCTYSHGDPAPACDVANETITYASVVSPIFDVHCRECHARSVASVKGGGNDFGSYATISAYPQNSMLGCIRRDPGYDPMPQGRDKLSDCDIQRIEKWYAQGKPQ